MTEIPEDVREAAIRAFYVEGFPGGDLPTAVMEQDILSMLHVAIIVERERAAKAAEAIQHEHEEFEATKAAQTQRVASSACAFTAKRIATAIRGSQL